MNRCLFCGGDAHTPEHFKYCDGRQGRVEAEIAARPFAGAPHFNGPEYDPEHDHARLTGQILRVWTLMRDGEWRTLQEIADLTGDPHASISAQLRHLRKKRFGEHTIDRRVRGDRSNGLFEYRLIPHHVEVLTRC